MMKWDKKQGLHYVTYSYDVWLEVLVNLQPMVALL